MLESTPASIPLIKSSHKWTQMLYIISNSKLWIWLCSQPRIDLNSQYKFYDVLTRPYKYLSNNLSTIYKRTTFTQYNLHVIFTRLWDFHAISKNKYFPLYPSLTIPHCHNITWAKFRTSEMSVPELPYSVSDHPLDCLRNTTKSIDDLCLDLNKLHESNQFMYNIMVKQLHNFKLQIQPLGRLSDHFQGTTLVLYLFQAINLVFRETMYDQDQTMYNYIAPKIQNVKLWMQSMVNLLTVSDLSLSEVTSQKIFFSDDLNPDLDPVQEIARVFSETSKFFTSLQCELS